MITEICLIVIAASFLGIIAFLVTAVCSLKTSLHQAHKRINELSANGLELIQRLNELTADLKKKSDSLNFIFRFLNAFNKKPAKSGVLQKNREQIAEIVDLVGSGVDLYQRVKRDITKYVKKGHL